MPNVVRQYETLSNPDEPTLRAIAAAAYGGHLPLRNKSSVSIHIGIKRCSICKAWLLRSDFGPDAGRADGLNSKCAGCAAAYAVEWTDRPGNVEKRRDYSRAQRERDPDAHTRRGFESRCRAYGITAERYEQMLAEQGGGCAVCDKTPEENGAMLAVDHDHACCPTSMRSCGECVRGLLCRRCNTAAGVLESPLHAKLVAYLAA